MSSAREQLRDGLVGPLADMDVDLEDVEVAKAGRRHVVRIIVDRDGGVDLDLVAAVSRRVSDLLDSPELEAALDGAYVLEVTSPGVDRPLTEPRHWRRAHDRLVRVEMADGSTVEGRIRGMSDDGTVTIAVGEDDTSVALADVTTALVQVEFNRKDATLVEEDETAVEEDETIVEEEK